MADLTTVGSILVDEVLPDDLKGNNRDLDKKKLQEIFNRMAEKDPEEYKRVLKELSDVGKRAAWTEGLSVSLASLQRGEHGEAAVQEARQKIQTILEDDSIDDEQRKEMILEEMVPLYKSVSDAVFEDARRRKSHFYTQVESGARGNKSAYNSMAGADLLTTGPNNQLIPIPLIHSYAEGFTPAEYFAAGYGQRRGQLDTKLAVGRAGFLSKKISNATHRQVVTREDALPTRLPTGLPTSSKDKDNIGAVLAKDAGKYPKGTILTAPILKDLQDDEVDDILVYSVTTDLDEDGGISAVAAGKRTGSGLPLVGENIGLPASQSIGERLSQGLLCLAAGTLVRIPDAEEKAIEDLRSGDVVLGSDTRGNTFPVKVLNVFNNGTRSCWKYSFQDGSTDKFCEVVCTADHKILSEATKTPLPAGKLAEDDLVTLPGGYAASLASKTFIGELPTFDIEVDHPDHLFVLGSGLIVSNSSKHSGGVSTRVDRSGLDYIERLIEAPETFQQVGPLSRTAGTVTKIADAPQGGKYVFVGDEKYHIPDGIGITVQEGQSLDVGDDLTDAPPHPAQLAELRGVGEARRVYTKMIYDALKDSGLSANRRNLESVAAGIVNHVRITNPDGIGEYLYDDVVPYSAIAATYTPRKTAKRRKPREAYGTYLEEPVLHYSIGTRVNKSVLADLEKWGIEDVDTDDNEPDFAPEFVPGILNAANDPDWQTRLSGFYTARSFTEALHRGRESNAESTSYVPAITRATGFGRQLPALGKYGQHE